MNGFTAARRARLSRFAAEPRARPDPIVYSELQISDARVYPLREPVSRRACTLVELQTKSGLRGYGECAALAVDDIAWANHLLIGRTATSYELVHKDLEQSPLRGAVNVALLDLVGKFARAPLYELLGGPTRNKVRAMVRLNGSNDAQLLASLRNRIAAGHRAFLVPLPTASALNQGQPLTDAVRTRLESLRTAAGKDVDFVLDGASSLTPRQASILGRAIEGFHLLWFDEPSRATNPSALKKIAAETVTPLGFGREITHSGDFQNFMREEIIDIIRPSVSRNGITPIRRMAAIAETHYVAVAPYHDGGPLATAAALHLAASLPNFFIQQIPVPEAEEDRRMRATMTLGSIETVEEGFAQLPSGAGLGVEVSPEAIRKYMERA